MKWRGVVLLLSLMAAIGLLNGCADRNEPSSSAALTVSEIGEQIRQAVNLSTAMEQGDAEKMKKIYHVEAEDIADFVLYTALSNVKADELAVIKVKDKADIEGIMNKFQQRIEAQTVKFKDYRPDEYYLLKKHVLKQEGPFILFAVSQNADRIESAFNAAVK